MNMETSSPRPDTAYPHSVLATYGQVVDSISDMDEIAKDTIAVLDAIENEAESDCQGNVIAALARTLKVRLAAFEEASINISEYCRSADVARELNAAASARTRRPQR